MAFKQVDLTISSGATVSTDICDFREHRLLGVFSSAYTGLSAGFHVSYSSGGPFEILQTDTGGVFSFSITDTGPSAVDIGAGLLAPWPYFKIYASTGATNADAVVFHLVMKT